jgi:hypothetical protein
VSLVPSSPLSPPLCSEPPTGQWQPQPQRQLGTGAVWPFEPRLPLYHAGQAGQVGFALRWVLLCGPGWPRTPGLRRSSQLGGIPHSALSAGITGRSRHAGCNAFF